MEQKAEQASIQAYRNMSPSRKWEQMKSLRAFAWNVKRAGIRLQHPEWSDEAVEDKVRELFLHATS